MDRMVGYRISPLLWAKIKRGLSAGRVQSVALRIICDREDEINAFIPEEYWSLDVNLKVKGEKKPICAKYYGTTEKKQGITSKEQADSIMDSLNGAKFEVKEVRHGERVKKAPLPFTTSTLQQEASKVLNFSTQKTMRLAQQLYEGVDIKGEGTVGLITYLRTDSTRVSEEAETQAAEFIDVHYGEKYKTAAATEKKNSQKIQDAHEAIRPTDLNRMPIAIKEQLPRDLFRLYQLIWKRFVASRMSAAQYDTTSVKIQAKDQIFALAASRMRFDGFMSVYTQEDDKEEENVLGGNLDENSVLWNSRALIRNSILPTPCTLHRSQSGACHGRTGHRTSQYLCAYHYHHPCQEIYCQGEPQSLRYGTGGSGQQYDEGSIPLHRGCEFHGQHGSSLDGVEEGTVKWKTIVSNFYPDLDEAVKKAEKDLAEVTIADEESDEVCELCGRRMVIKYGPHGRFLACPGFPECRNTKPYFEKIGVACPKCGKDIVMKKDQKRQKILWLYR